ncbi:sensor histidine kinase [Opitutaceae bacterium]
MDDIEILEIPPLSPQESCLLDMHTLLNMMNVLRGELFLIGLNLAGKGDLLHRSLATCDEMVRSLSDAEGVQSTLRNHGQSIEIIQADIDSALAAHPEKRSDPDLIESLGNLESVFAILRARSCELIARLQAPGLWTAHSIPELRRSFMEIFSAIEKNSHGRYRLIYNVALKKPLDYYIDFKIESYDGEILWMPPVIQDVMRDLIANARKYTLPGGRITAALYGGKDWLTLHVEDTGRGIPSRELARVIEYGRRGSNVGDVRTMGGGFGLTKAFVVTKQFGGRFWIASEVGVGTRIRIKIPRPPGLPPRLTSAPAH